MTYIEFKNAYSQLESDEEKYVCLMSEDEYIQLKNGGNFTFKYDLAKKL